MRLAAHLLLERGYIVGVFRVPNRKRRPPAVANGVRVGIVLAELPLRGGLVVVREVAQEQEREHVVAEVVRVHRPAQLVGDVPQGFAELFLIAFSHWCLISLRSSPPTSLHPGTAQS